jgi:hypothetical protein
MKPINHIPSPSSPPFTLSSATSTYFTVLPFIINSKVLIFKGVSQWISAVNIVTLVSTTPSINLPYHFLQFSGFSIHIVIFSTCTDVIGINIVDYHSLFLYLLPKFYRAAPLLQTCCTYKFVYDHVCFMCISIFLIYIPHMRENMWLLSFRT